ncbi:MAG: 4Fe-4S dicluster domain-containing protein [Planctomycetota bacterium]|nr:4Fe-4S dicluster domain-containing protein [Planctomycetota bacterium]
MTAYSKHASAAEAPDRVLATLNADGSRHWINPKLSIGRFLHGRRVVAYVLIAVFAVLPYITINGKPAMLIDIAHRRFTLFGVTFFPTDTVLMAVLMLCIFLSIFLITAMFGRVWCGWACPQTVYMEFLYRPIERLFDGAPGSVRSKRPAAPALRVLKYLVFFVFSCYLAHVFLAYFVGIERLATWVTRSPFEHPASFAIMAVVTGLMMFDFVFFREQTCLVACPYGRLQSVMLDRDTLIVAYDYNRGEPRGKKQRKGSGTGATPSGVSLRVVDNPHQKKACGCGPGGSCKRESAEAAAAALPEPEEIRRGDCVDCNLCVTTCPTGIDIRNGLQMECIGCAQCIDACDAVMSKIGKPTGLIRYSSRAILEGKARHILRPRLVLYPTILLGLMALFVYLLVTRAPAEAAVLPRQGAPFYTLPTGEVANQVRLRLVNRTDEPAQMSVSLPPEALGAGARLVIDEATVSMGALESSTVGFILTAPPELFSGRGAYMTELVVTGGDGFSKRLPFRMLGPARRAEAPDEWAPAPTEEAKP